MYINNIPETPCSPLWTNCWRFCGKHNCRIDNVICTYNCITHTYRTCVFPVIESNRYAKQFELFAAEFWWHLHDTEDMYICNVQTYAVRTFLQCIARDACFDVWSLICGLLCIFMTIMTEALRTSSRYVCFVVLRTVLAGRKQEYIQLRAQLTAIRKGTKP